MVGAEWPGVGAGSHRHQDGRVHLEETSGVEELPDAADDPAAKREYGHNIGVGDKVQVTLPVPDLHVLQAVEFLGQGPHPLGGHGEFTGIDGYLAGAGTHDVARNAQVVTQV